MLTTLGYLAKGFFVGLVVSVPLGPIGLVTIENTISRGIRAGFVSAATVAGVDILAAGLVLLGFHESISYFHTIPFWVHILGSIIVFGYGLSLFKKKVRTFLAHQSLTQSFLETIVLVVSNPATYLSFGIIALLFGASLRSSAKDHVFLFIGFLTAASLWWSMIVLAAEGIKSKLLKTTNLQKIIGVCLMISAVAVLLLPGKGIVGLHRLFR